MFPSEIACANYLQRVRWPGGFTCPTCGVNDQAQPITTRPRVIRCMHCCADLALTAGTVMHATRTPLQAWFLGAYLVTTQTPGVSAVQLQRQLGLARYETALVRIGRLKWMKRLWVDAPKAKDEAFTIKRCLSVEVRPPVRFKPMAKSPKERSMLEDCVCVLCQTAAPRRSSDSCRRT